MRRFAIALGRAAQSLLAQVGSRRLAWRQGVARKLVAQVLQREAEPLAQLSRLRHRFRQIREEAFHLARGLQAALGVGVEQPPRVIQLALETEAGKRVEKMLAILGVVADTVRGKQAQTMRPRKFDAGAIGAFLLAHQMALQFDVHIAGPEDAAHRILVPQIVQQGDEPRGIFLNVLPARPALALGSTQVHAGQQAAEVAVPDAALHQDRQPPIQNCVRRPLLDTLLFERDFAADQRAHADGARSLEQARRSGNRIPVAQRQGRVTETRGRPDQVLRIRRPFQEAEP